MTNVHINKLWIITSIIHFSFIAAGLPFLSCEREVNIELPAFEQKLVINSFLEKDSIIKITIAGTGSPFDERINWIEDATVILYCGSNCDTLVRLDSGLYQSTFTAAAFQEYQVTASAPGYPPVCAKVTVPETIIGFGISNLRDSVATTEEGRFYSEFTLSFEDNADSEDYYELSVFHVVHFNNYADPIWSVPCFTNDPTISQNNNQGIYRLSLLFDDKNINGQSVGLNVDYYPHSYNTGELVCPDSIIVYLKSVSKSYYQYKKMLPEHLNAQEYDFWQGQGDPVQMFTNIEGGYGIFGAYSTVRDTLSH